jgi:methionine-rich copper-binding protein CopC
MREQLKAACVAAVLAVLAPAMQAQAPSSHAHAAAGHGGMKTRSSIADGAVLDASPPSLTLDFGHPMRLTNVRLSNAAGEIIPVTFNTPATGTSSALVSLPRLDRDRYTIAWSADAGDHTMGGTVRFEIR